MGKPEKSCIGSGSDISVQQEWLHEAEGPCVSALVSTIHLSTVCLHTASTETFLHAVLRGPRLWWSSACAHTQLLLCVRETNGPWWFLFFPQYNVNFCRSWIEVIKCHSKEVREFFWLYEYLSEGYNLRIFLYNLLMNIKKIQAFWHYWFCLKQALEKHIYKYMHTFLAWIFVSA